MEGKDERKKAIPQPRFTKKGRDIIMVNPRMVCLQTKTMGRSSKLRAAGPEFLGARILSVLPGKFQITTIYTILSSLGNEISE